MAKELPPGTLLSDEPFKADIGGGIVSDRPAGRQPTARETSDLMAELAHRATAQQRDAAKGAAEAKRDELIEKLAPSAAAAEFNPARFGGEDLKLFAKLVAAKAKPESGIDAKAAQALVLGELRAAHEAKVLEAARAFKAPIIDADGMAPGDRSIIESAAAAKPATERKITVPKDALPGQGDGRAIIGKWTSEHAQKPEGLGKLR